MNMRCITLTIAGICLGPWCGQAGLGLLHNFAFNVIKCCEYYNEQFFITLCIQSQLLQTNLLMQAMDLGRGANPKGYMVEEIWQELAKAKYLQWEHASTKRLWELQSLKYVIPVSLVICFEGKDHLF